MTVEVHPVTDRASWLARRTQDVTASDVAPLAGVGPKGGRTAYRVYLEKAGLITPDEADSNLMWRGRLLEPAVIAAVAEREPEWTIKPAGVYVRDSVIRLGATPDAVALNPKRPGIGNIECKVVSRPVFEEHWRADDGSVRPPLYYQLQTLAQATLMDAQWSQLAALVIATFSVELCVIDIDRHEPAETRIRNISAEFWRNLGAGRFAPPDFSRDGETIDELHSEVRRTVVDLRGDNRLPAALAERAAVVAARKEADKRVKELDAEIKHKIGDAEEALVNGWRLTWKQVHRAGYSVEPTDFRKLGIKNLSPQGEEH
jgi:predicted phage-related endonuclease